MSNKLLKPYTDIQRADFVCLHQGLNYYEDDNCIIMYSNSEKIENGEAIDIEQTKTLTYYKIVSKYDQAIKNGVFQINSEYYGNMSWYDTWTKALNLYESGLILADTFTVRLYKRSTLDSEKYYNCNTTQTLPSFKSMIQTLNSRQFLQYQPIRNNLISQLKLATTIDTVNSIDNLIESSFGDIIDETKTIVQDGE